MPLYSGKESVGRNVKTLLKEGRPRKQAIAIAMHKAGLSRLKKKKGTRRE